MMTTPPKTNIEIGCEYIAKHPGCRTPDLAKAMNIPPKNVHATLATAIAAGYIVTCRVERPGMQAVSEFRISATVSDHGKVDWATFKVSRQASSLKAMPGAQRPARVHDHPTPAGTSPLTAVTPTAPPISTRSNEESSVSDNQPAVLPENVRPRVETCPNPGSHVPAPPVSAGDVAVGAKAVGDLPGSSAASNDTPAPPAKDPLAQIRKKLDSWELVHLRALVRELHDRLEAAEDDAQAGWRSAEFWQENAMNLQAALAEQGHTIYMTKDGEIFAQLETVTP